MIQQRGEREEQSLWVCEKEGDLLLRLSMQLCIESHRLEPEVDGSGSGQSATEFYPASTFSDYKLDVYVAKQESMRRLCWEQVPGKFLNGKNRADPVNKVVFVVTTQGWLNFWLLT